MRITLARRQAMLLLQNVIVSREMCVNDAALQRHIIRGIIHCPITSPSKYILLVGHPLEVYYCTISVQVLFHKVAIYYSDLSACTHIFEFNVIYFTSGKVNNLNNVITSRKMECCCTEYHHWCDTVVCLYQ